MAQLRRVPTGAGAFRLRVPHRFLFLAAGLAWTLAGGMLLGRAWFWLAKHGDHLLVRAAIAASGGLAFFFLLFSRVSRRHVGRIEAMNEPRPLLLAFFDRRSYLLMGLMIAGGLLLRSSRLVPPSLLYTFYACMGTPLLLSALRFYLSFARQRVPERG